MLKLPSAIFDIVRTCLDIRGMKRLRCKDCGRTRYERDMESWKGHYSSGKNKYWACLDKRACRLNVAVNEMKGKFLTNGAT